MLHLTESGQRVYLCTLHKHFHYHFLGRLLLSLWLFMRIVNSLQITRGGWNFSSRDHTLLWTAASSEPLSPFVNCVGLCLNTCVLLSPYCSGFYPHCYDWVVIPYDWFLYVFSFMRFVFVFDFLFRSWAPTGGGSLVVVVLLQRLPCDTFWSVCVCDLSSRCGV